MLNKILIVNTADQGGGAERFVTQLAEGLRRRGIESRLIVGDKQTDDPSVVPIFQSPFVDHRPYAGRGFRIRKALLEAAHERLGIENFFHPYSRHLLSMSGAKPPDLVFLNNLHGGYFDLRILRDLGHRVPVVIRLSDCWLFTGHCALPLQCERWLSGCGRCPDLSLPPAVKRDATRFNLGRKKRIYNGSRFSVVTSSEWLLDRARRSVLAPAIRGHKVIPNGVEINTFKPGSQAAARRRLDIPANEFVILFVANLGYANPYKDYRTIEESARLLGRNTEMPPTRLIVVGQGGAGKVLGSVRIDFRDYCANPAEVAEYYQAADMYLHAAIEETFGSVIVEAMACGLPVVATNTGGIPEVVTDDTGIVVPPHDPPAMAEAIRNLMNHPDRRRRMGREGLTRARARFDSAQMIDRYLQWLREILPACGNNSRAGDTTAVDRSWPAGTRKP